MKLFNPLETTQIFPFITRFIPSEGITLVLNNSVNDPSTESITEIDLFLASSPTVSSTDLLSSSIFEEIEDNSYIYRNGITYLYPVYQPKEGERGSITIKQGNDILYRGKYFSTSQVAQEYSQTINEYEYQ